MKTFLSLLVTEELNKEGLSGYSYGYRDRVRFYELDALNHVNNVAFLKWFETVRVNYIQHYGFTSYKPDDPMMVVRRVSADFLAPMFQDEDYVVAAKSTLIKPSSFLMEYAVAVNGQIRATGDAVFISLERDGKTRRPHNAQAVENAVQKDGAALAS